MKSRHAFTLIELLVVIAIIALLLAILTPALGKAKDKARDIICRSHAKGLGRAILVYLQENDSRAFNSNGSNGINWTDATGAYLTPSHPDWDAAYWAVGYVDYIEDPRACGCPSYKVAALFDPSNNYYKPLAGQTAEELGRLTGFGLNAFFFKDVKEPSGTVGRYNRKTSAIRSPSTFIIAQDHPEPKIEGWSASADPSDDQDDMMYVRANYSVNLRHYRPSTVGGRGNATNENDRCYDYTTIFRHNKRSAALDDPMNMTNRIAQINNQPNGQSTTIFLDGSVESIPEHTSDRVTERQYTGS